ncbi:MAG: GNAT family N-acetyltransferase, partial [Candidatus Thorarchaeota archaeon]
SALILISNFHLVPFMTITPRPLLKTDIPDVLEISKTTWDGNDHLPDVIEKWLDDPDTHLFGIESEGHVVSIGGLHVIDNGKTGWMEGLRVHEKFREKGLARIMTDHIVKIAEELKVTRIRLVTASVSEAPRKLAISVGMKETLGFTVFWKSLEQVEWAHQSISFDETDVVGFHKAIKSNPTLLPQNILISHWDAYDANEHNVGIIAEKANFWIGSKSDNISALTLGTVRETEHGPEWCFTVYAGEVDSFKSTMSFNLDEARKRNCVSILCTHTKQFDSAHKQIEWLETTDFGFDLLLYERVL